VLLVRERRGLPRGAARNEPVDTGVDLELDERPERFLVDGAVAKRRDECREHTFEHD
jgi:hypothetical protein